MTEDIRCWAIIPAAGFGIRMGTSIPKQYLKIRDQYVLDYSLRQLSGHPRIEAVVAVLSQHDPYWPKSGLAGNDKLITAIGGAERCHSVLNGLAALEGHARPDDWVLVHDAARPCLRAEDLDKLIQAVYQHPVGGILATPARDTMKQTGSGNTIQGTISREQLWHALTPQMFRYSALSIAIQESLDGNIRVTDESQAIELTGKQPILVEGQPDNIKITHYHDLALAELYLAQQER